MFEENKNIKDTSSSTVLDRVNSMSNRKVNKLITALYMVTDIMDKEEPIRNKLRILGVEILSDTQRSPTNASKKIMETLSFLDIVLVINLISEMNYSILKSEFLALKKYIDEYQDNPAWIENLLKEDSVPEKGFLEDKMLGNKSKNLALYNHTGKTEHPLGQDKFKRTYEKLPVEKVTHSPIYIDSSKEERRTEILKIIKEKNGVTIKDIRIRAKEIKALASCSEKTLQRELIAMVKDGTLKKIGDKRWSQYWLKSFN
jgi:hypothetical protein